MVSLGWQTFKYRGSSSEVKWPPHPGYETRLYKRTLVGSQEQKRNANKTTMIMTLATLNPLPLHLPSDIDKSLTVLHRKRSWLLRCMNLLSNATDHFQREPSHHIWLRSDSWNYQQSPGEFIFYFAKQMYPSPPLPQKRAEPSRSLLMLADFLITRGDTDVQTAGEF